MLGFYGGVLIGPQAQVTAGDCVYVSSGQNHSLVNTGTEDLVMMFVYSPATIVDHWKQEQEGSL